MKTLLIMLLLSSAVLASEPTIPFSTKTITDNAGKKIRIIQPMLPVYFEIEGNTVGMADHEVLICRLLEYKRKDVGDTGKTIQEDADIECKDGLYKLQVRRVLFDTNAR